MDDGMVVEAGAPHKMFRAPDHPWTRAFLSAVLDRQAYQ